MRIRPRATVIRRSIGVSPFVPGALFAWRPGRVDFDLGPTSPGLRRHRGVRAGYCFAGGVVAGDAGSAAGAAVAAGATATEDEAAAGPGPGVAASGAFAAAAECAACAVSLSFACSARHGALSSFSWRLRHCNTRPPEWGTVAQKAWTSGSQSAAEARKSFFNWSRRP